MSNIALQIERSFAGTVVSGANVVFETTVFSAGNVSYNNLTGVITFNEAGRYVFNWWITTQSSLSLNGVVFALSSSQGDFLEGNSPVKTGEVVGFGIIEVVAAPVTVSLVNVSTADVFFATLPPLKATLIVIEDDIVATGLTGATGATGDIGATGATGIVNISFTGSNDSVPFDVSGSAMVELTLPSITLEPNQVVKLDAFANLNLISVQSYSVNSFISRNPTDIVTVDNDAIFQASGQPNFEQVIVTTAITWVDNPGPGTYVYTYTIIGLAPFGIAEGSIDSRGFTAIIIFG